MIACCLFALKHMDDYFVYVIWIGILLFFNGCCVLKMKFFEKIFRKHFIRKNEFELLQ